MKHVKVRFVNINEYMKELDSDREKGLIYRNIVRVTPVISEVIKQGIGIIDVDIWSGYHREDGSLVFLRYPIERGLFNSVPKEVRETASHHAETLETAIQKLELETRPGMFVDSGGER